MSTNAKEEEQAPDRKVVTLSEPVHRALKTRAAEEDTSLQSLLERIVVSFLRTSREIEAQMEVAPPEPTPPESAPPRKKK